MATSTLPAVRCVAPSRCMAFVVDACQDRTRMYSIASDSAPTDRSTGIICVPDQRLPDGFTPVMVTPNWLRQHPLQGPSISSPGQDAGTTRASTQQLLASGRHHPARRSSTKAAGRWNSSSSADRSASSASLLRHVGERGKTQLWIQTVSVYVLVAIVKKRLEGRQPLRFVTDPLG